MYLEGVRREGVDLIHLAWVSIQWQADLNMVINFLDTCSQKHRKFGN
jgi:hypothetical protein